MTFFSVDAHAQINITLHDPESWTFAVEGSLDTKMGPSSPESQVSQAIVTKNKKIPNEGHV